MHDIELSLYLPFSFSHFGFDNEEVYLVYIRIIITVWSSGYEDRIADVIKLINNWKKFAMILSNVLTKGVSNRVPCAVYSVV